MYHSRVTATEVEEMLVEFLNLQSQFDKSELEDL